MDWGMIIAQGGIISFSIWMLIASVDILYRMNEDRKYLLEEKEKEESMK